MVQLTPLAQAQVVVGRHGIDHLTPYIIVGRQGQRTSDDTLDVVPAVGRIVVLIAGEYILLYVCLNILVHSYFLQR